MSKQAPKYTGRADFWKSMSLEELAEQQGVSAVSDLDEISALWPVDDDPDQLLDWVLHQRAKTRLAKGEMVDDK